MSWVPFATMMASQVMDSLKGGDEMQKVDTMNRGQKKLLKQMTGMLNDGSLGQGHQGAIDYQRQLMDPNSAAVNQFAQPYIDQFNQQTVPGLAERFAGMGGMGGGLSSSGFGQSLSTAGSNLQTQLAQLKAMLGQQAASSLMGHYGNMSGQALSAQPFAYQQQAPSMMGGVLQGWGQGGFGGMQGGGGGATPRWGSASNANLYNQAQNFTA